VAVKVVTQILDRDASAKLGLIIAQRGRACPRLA